MNGVALVVLTDGRDCVYRSVPSALHALRGPVTNLVMFDDSGDEEHRQELRREFPNFTHVNFGPRRGYGTVMHHAWQWITDHVTERWVFWLEDDFTFNRDVPLDDMAAVLDTNPHLVQMALRRQPWNETELAAGGIVEALPQAYTDHHDDHGRHWLEHRQFWTSNPSLFRTDICELGWPDVPLSEAAFAAKILDDHPERRCAFYGPRHDTPWVEHVGYQRAGTGY